MANDVLDLTEAEYELGYIVIRFAPDDLPSGMIDGVDQSNFVVGLQEIVDALLVDEYQTTDVPEELHALNRLIVVETRIGSHELLLSLKPILDDFGRFVQNVESNPLLLTTAVTLMNSATRDSYRIARRQLGKLVLLIHNLAAPNAKRVSSFLLSKADPGLRKLTKVMAKRKYQRDPITLRTDKQGDSSLILDETASLRITSQLESRAASGDMRVYGQVDGIDRKNNNFRVTVKGFGQMPEHRVECRYVRPMYESLRDQGIMDALVIVLGIPHYRKGSDGTFPPEFIAVKSVSKTQNVPEWSVEYLGPRTAMNEAPIQEATAIQTGLWDIRTGNL